MSKATQPTDDSTDVQNYTIQELSESTAYSTENHRVIDFGCFKETASECVSDETHEFEGQHSNTLFLNRETDATTISVNFDTVKIKGMSPDDVLDPYFQFHNNDVKVGSIDFDQISSELKELLMEQFL